MVNGVHITARGDSLTLTLITLIGRMGGRPTEEPAAHGTDGGGAVGMATSTAGVRSTSAATASKTPRKSTHRACERERRE